MKRKYLGLFFIILTAAYMPIATAGKCDKGNCCEVVDESCDIARSKCPSRPWAGKKYHYDNYGSKSCKRKNGVFSTCGMAVKCNTSDTKCECAQSNGCPDTPC